MLIAAMRWVRPIDALRCGLGALSLALALHASPALGQGNNGEGAAGDQQPSGELVDGTFVDAVEVKVLNVDVYVRDKDGNPVTGLTAEDFEIFEDKRPMPITNFYEVREGRRTDVEEDTRTQLERIKADPSYDPRIGDEPADQRLYLVVYVDHFNVRPHHRNRVFRHLREFLRDHVDRNDRVMLVSYNRSIKIEREFTSDPQVISGALFELEKHTGGRTQADSDRIDLLRELQSERNDAGLIRARVKMYAENQYNDLQFTLDAMRDFVAGLGGIPGRKAILYVSDGLPMRAGDDLFQAATERFPEELSSLRMESMQYDATRRFSDIARLASTHRVAFYTLDASGLMGRSDRGADVGSIQQSPLVNSTWAANMQAPLMFLADETGGQYLVNSQNFGDALDRFATDFEHYYSLGYSPGHAGSGRLYDVEVRLKNRKELRVSGLRYRNNYRDLSVEKEMADGTLASLQFGFEQNDLDLSLVERDLIEREDGTYMMHLDLRVPIGELTLLPRPEYHLGRFRVWVQARDRKGNVSDVGVRAIDVRVEKEDYERAQKMYYTYPLTLQVAPGEQRIAIGLRDDFGGRRAFLNKPYRIGS
ncbi:MAG TPA: VWA domain-containing protein [Thermoanaerobaculia bacterium]|nr:VWA domain-containing protein [Thermoanaerobaculia bacterium]